MRNAIRRPSRIVTKCLAGALSSTIRNAGLGPLLIVISLVSVLSLSGAAVTEAWVQRYNGPANSTDGGRAVAVDKAGNVVVTGHSNAGVDADEDFYTAKYAGTNGMLLWERRYAGPSNGWDLVYAMTLDNAGNVVVAGITDLKFGTFGAHEGGDYYTAKYAATDGALLWEKGFNGPADATDYAYAVAVDGSGNVIVTGASGNSRVSEWDTDYYTAKYAAADGALLWQKRYHGPSFGSVATAVAVDRNGDVAVTGHSYIIGSLSYYTVKYAGLDGRLLWEKRTEGPGYIYDFPVALVTDAQGNVIVTGTSQSDPGAYNFLTVKYAAADGTMLWQQSYNGPTNRVDVARGVAVDSDGNVVVIGSSGLSFTNDFQTIKYAATDGALLWQRTYNSPGNGDDQAAAVALDERGNVVVAGTIRDGIGIADYYTAKYSAADGALLWEKRYNGPANGYDGVADLAHSVAIGPEGRVVITGSSDSDPGFNLTYDFATVVYRELVAPVINCSSNLLTNCTGAGQAVVHFTVTATDESAIPPVVTCRPDSGSAFPVGQSTVNCTALDDDGLSSTCSFTVTVVDAAAPLLSCPSNLVTEPTSEAGTMVAYAVTATDVCDPVPVVDCQPQSGQVFAIGETTVHCTARDVNGNSAACSFNVTVLGARGIKQNIVAELTSWRAVSDPGDAKQLDVVIQHLTDSLTAGLWMDETHVDTIHGERVFLHESLAVGKLCQWIHNRRSQVPEAILQGFIDRIFLADRLLAVVAIEDARAAGASSRDLQPAPEFLARGDRAVGDDRCSDGIVYYRQAWKHALNALRPGN